MRRARHEPANPKSQPARAQVANGFRDMPKWTSAPGMRQLWKSSRPMDRIPARNAGCSVPVAAL
ncbi:hypothetical protein SLNWT_7081 [Streptomyces albus]|uniref:Uncharacterized protein n=1 Tax=Streptomyces albus (strain ATCC 21838 / DSM 41398 / FERM P-419 / JCM 4703 / NBRC 107858) TaxID=1081613 RepID=A0A0B5FAH1_STRA4|nr:hypothetical protein SLNWT_7081 [Streptomyces albus]AOU81760.1 hypothetical protein SLNHY_7069 [Streptomyces albus]AYN37449.1 hypothetical protein DUI70_6956 [Streptomyces albus]